MQHILEATYQDGILKLDQPLPLRDQEKVRVIVQTLSKSPHSVLDIEPIDLGEFLQPSDSDEDLLGEMLEGRT